MINFRTEILKALPIPNFFTWWHDNWPGFDLHVWTDELIEMEREGIVKIERGRVELAGLTGFGYEIGLLRINNH